MYVKKEMVIGPAYSVFNFIQTYTNGHESQQRLPSSHDGLFNPIHSYASRCYFEEFCLLGYNAVQSVESQPTFRTNMSPPCSGSKNTPRKKPAWSWRQANLATCCESLISYKYTIFTTLHDFLHSRFIEFSLVTSIKLCPRNTRFLWYTVSIHTWPTPLIISIHTLCSVLSV
jgi:hypothetical protein